MSGGQLALALVLIAIFIIGLVDEIVLLRRRVERLERRLAELDDA